MDEHMKSNNWKDFYLHRLFTATMGNGIDAVVTTNNPNGINYVGRGEGNNGVMDIIDMVDGATPFPSGCITLALGGSLGSCYVQPRPFYTSQNVAVLREKVPLTANTKLFLATLISYECSIKFVAFGRELNSHFRKDFVIKLPVLRDAEGKAIIDAKCRFSDDGYVPDFEWMDSYIRTLHYKPIATKIKSQNKHLSTQGWKNYRLDALFDFKKGTRLTKEDMEDGDVNYLGAIDSNNGIRQKIVCKVKDQYEPNCITVNYNGSVGEAFYQIEPFWASDDVNVLYAKPWWLLNKFIAMFIITVIKANKYKFDYGRKWTLKKMKESTILLPATNDGKPDFIYMENYIKTLPYSDRI